MQGLWGFRRSTIYWVIQTREEQGKVKRVKKLHSVAVGTEPCPLISPEKLLEGQSVSVEWQGSKPECFRERRGDNMCGQFFQKAWFRRGGENEGCSWTVMGLEQCFSNWDRWKYSWCIRPTSINTCTLYLLDAHLQMKTVSDFSSSGDICVYNQIAARQEPFKDTFWTEMVRAGWEKGWCPLEHTSISALTRRIRILSYAVCSSFGDIRIGMNVLEKTLRLKENKEKQREQNIGDEIFVLLKKQHKLKA